MSWLLHVVLMLTLKVNFYSIIVFPFQKVAIHFVSEMFCSIVL